MKRRKRMNRKHSRKVFHKTAKRVHPLNRRALTRGGERM